MKTVLTAITLLSVLVLVGAPIAMAADGDLANPPSSNIDTPQKVITLLEKITNWMFTIFMAVAVIMIIYAAFIYLTSGGGEETSHAHKIILYAAIAIVVAMTSRGIVKIVENFTTV